MTTAGCVGMLVWGWYSDRTGGRCWNLAMASLSGAVGLAVAGLFNDSYWGLLAMCVASVGQNGTKPCFWPLPSTLMTGSAAAASIAAINSVGNLGGYVGPFIVGWIKDSTNSFEIALYFLAACSLASGAVAFFANRACGAQIGRLRGLAETR